MNTDTTQNFNLSRDEWERRYAARLMSRGGMEERIAMACARGASEEFESDERAAGNVLSWDEPEEMADEEMSYWENDGE